jgi:hypothetical protein
MDIRMEQQQKELAVMHEKFVQNVINQVPLFVHNAFLGMEGVMNIAPLQLKGSSSSQPSLMLTEGSPMPQDSGTSMRGESTGMETSSLPDISGHQSQDKAHSLSPPNSTVAPGAITMDVDDSPAD